ncbi:hypothetical protein AMS69_14050 [Haloarcula rubripromontorii]|uniref:Uncharacterized protein n=2 Tax=Haloarcula rubripromontorii TaxID=1705562 RepID=A0A0N0BNG5_9EURY|nr:hypothetical protein AMS69_14050 [Haloarcula rubripromontorii]
MGPGFQDTGSLELRKMARTLSERAKRENVYSENEEFLSYIEDLSQTLAQHILQAIPSVQKYDGPKPIPDEQSISELEEGDFYYELLRYAELKPSEFNELNPIKRRKIRELASKELTELFNEFWRQEDMAVLNRHTAVEFTVSRLA